MGDRDFGEDRREYRKTQLDESMLPDDPLLLLDQWLEQARTSGTIDPTAMTLSTTGPAGIPSSRIVLLKGIEAGKLLFFTSLNSRKAQEIQSNPMVALHFYWPGLERQVKIAGSTQMLEESKAESYFQSRPYESKLSTWISPQSKVIPDRRFLEEAFEKKRNEYGEGDLLPRPPHWGGYAVSPKRMEFWQGGKYRLHDRMEYSLKKGQWKRVRLAP
jgi:pyridoxamine 5'-phosphate oxidase